LAQGQGPLLSFDSVEIFQKMGNIPLTRTDSGSTGIRSANTGVRRNGLTLHACHIVHFPLRKPSGQNSTPPITPHWPIRLPVNTYVKVKSDTKYGMKHPITVANRPTTDAYTITLIQAKPPQKNPSKPGRAFQEDFISEDIGLRKEFQ